MGEILNFPNRFKVEPRQYRIPLYTGADVDVVLFCINAFGDTEKRVIIDDLIQMDPIIVMECLDFALESDMISSSTKEHIKCIRNSVEEK